MNTYHDIEQLEDIKLLVDTFYTNIREDALLGSIFNERIKDRCRNIWIKCTAFGKPFC
jgi:hemoglobin